MTTTNYHLPSNSAPFVAVRLTAGLYKETDPMYVKMMSYVQRQDYFNICEAIVAGLVTRRPEKCHKWIAETLGRALHEHPSETETLLDVLIRCSALSERMPVGGETYAKAFELNPKAYDEYLDKHQIFKNLADCLKDVAKDDRTGTKGEVMGMHAVQKWFQKLYVEAEKQAGNPGFQ